MRSGVLLVYPGRAIRPWSNVLSPVPRRSRVLIQGPPRRVYSYCCAPGRPGMAVRKATMSDEHLDNLRQARAQLIEQRRVFVRVLAGPYDRGKTEQAREGFMETQAAIEAMDRAIEDEEGTRRAVYDRS
jgi:hypothetical protein